MAIAVTILVIAAILVRIPFLDSLTPDSRDFVKPWLDHLTANGLSALGAPLPSPVYGLQGNYTPPYYYLLWLVSPLNGIIPGIWLIKAITFLFEGFAAYLAFRLIEQRASRWVSLAGAAAVLLAPTVIANGAWWGQCDVIWASLILASFYATTKQRPLSAIVFFGVALAFKAQSIFFGPYLFLLFLRDEIKLWHFAAIPIVYAAAMAPAVALGRSWIEAFTIYAEQGAFFHKLSLNAPNLYYFMPSAFYEIGTKVGLILTAIACAGLAVFPRATKVELDPALRILAATMFVALAPFLLPKMHDRYFFAADLFSIILAFYAPRFWAVPVVFQISSIAAYVPQITKSLFGEEKPTTLPLAVMLATLTVIFLVSEYYRACTRKDRQLGEASHLYVTAALAILAAVLTWIVAAAARQVVSAKICPQGGPLGRAICDGEMPLNLSNASLSQWALFFAILAISYPIANLTVRYIRNQIWPHAKSMLPSKQSPMA
ncbi:MAG: glycosyltransferase 87 family protein [Caulobacterales bacterium]